MIRKTKPMRVIKNTLLVTLGVMVCLPMAYLIGAWIGAYIPAQFAHQYDRTHPVHKVLLISGPIHYDFLLPLTPQVRQAFSFTNTSGLPIHTQGAQWLLVGWGARDFYTTVGKYQDLTLEAVARGIFGDRSVLRLDVLGPITDHAKVTSIMLSDDQFNALSNNILDEFASHTKLNHSGFNESDAFFPAKSRFNIFYPCNQWVSTMLRQSGVPIGAWTPTPYSLKTSLRNNSVLTIVN